MISIQTMLWTAMALALLGSLRHVAWTFASIDGNVAWGWAQAIAIDAGLVAIALGITQYRRLKRDTRLLWLGVVVFTAISVYANACYGVEHDWQLPDRVLASAPILAQVPDWLRAVKVLVLAAPLPLLVLYLAEIVGSDVSHQLREAQRAEERDKARETRELRQQLVASEQRIRELEQRLNERELLPRERFEQWLTENSPEDYTQAQLAEMFGVSRQAVGEWLRRRARLEVVK